MVSDKMIVSVLLLGWRAVRVLALLLFGSRNRAATAQAAFSAVSRPHRTGFQRGLTWTMVAALLAIGVPLANTDREFKERAVRDVQVIAQLVAKALPHAE